MLKKEAIGGFTTFLTVSYIVIVNPSILSSPGTGISFSGAMTATVLLCFAMTMFMGLFAKLPFAVAPGMGINAFFTYTIILGMGVPWQTALGMVFWSGVFFVFISIGGLRSALVRAIPVNLRLASAVGIGLFLSFIGLRNAGFIEADSTTLVRFAGISVELGLSIVGLLCTVFLIRAKKAYAMIIAIAVVTILALTLGRVSVPHVYFELPDFNSVFLKFDPWGALRWEYV